jgi:3-dehydroquinate synthase
MNIKSKFKDYEVVQVDSDSFFKELAQPNAYYVIDKNVYELYPELFQSLREDFLFILESTEENKTIEMALAICERITKLPAKRNVSLISCGGGIVQDVTGFVANVMYRGIKWIFIPTTLLAACDSCIGGKTSLNYKSYKNLLGTFYPPDHVFLFTRFFDTLSERDFLSGLGEVVKFNIMRGEAGIESMERDLNLLLARDKVVVGRFVETSLEFKKPFIEADEFDKGERILLNFAHTFGHSLEVTSRYHIPHGTAVAIGMMIAGEISLKRGDLRKSIFDRIKILVKAIVRIDLEREWFEINSVINAMKKDKKQTGDTLTAILLDSDFRLNIKNDLTTAEVSQALLFVFDYLVS